MYDPELIEKAIFIGATVWGFTYYTNRFVFHDVLTKYNKLSDEELVERGNYSSPWKKFAYTALGLEGARKDEIRRRKKSSGEHTETPMEELESLIKL